MAVESETEDGGAVFQPFEMAFELDEAVERLESHRLDQIKCLRRHFGHKPLLDTHPTRYAPPADLVSDR